MKPLTMLLGLPLLFGLSTAFAADPPSRVPTSASSSQDPRGSHCVVQLKPVGPREKVSWTKELGCFPTFAEAIKAAIGVNIRPNTTPGTITPAEARSAQAAIIGIDYDLPGYNGAGASQTWFARDQFGCINYTYTANEPSTFINMLSSTRAFNGCNRNWNFTDFNQQGLYELCTPDCPVMRYDNATSSKLWQQ